MDVTIEYYLRRAKDWPASYNIYPMDEVGYYKVDGEDPNADSWSGPHFNPFVGIYHGTFRNVLSAALSNPEFVSWGYGGKITKVNITEV